MITGLGVAEGYGLVTVLTIKNVEETNVFKVKDKLKVIRMSMSRHSHTDRLGHVYGTLVQSHKRMQYSCNIPWWGTTDAEIKTPSPPSPTVVGA